MFQEDLYKEILDNIQDGVFFVTKEGVISFWNKGAEKITGYTKEDMIGKSCFDKILTHADIMGEPLNTSGCLLEEAIKIGKGKEIDEIYLEKKNGIRIPVFAKTYAIKDKDENVIGGVEVFNELPGIVDEGLLKKLKEMEHFAIYDSLTDVFNSEYIEILIDHQLEVFTRYSIPFGIILVDIDRLKIINEEFGRLAGDEALKFVASIVKNNVRKVDYVGRVENDKFIILLPACNKSMLFSVGKKVLSLVKTSRLISNTKILPITISAGGSLIKENEIKEEFIKRVDELLYKVKEKGGSDFLCE